MCVYLQNAYVYESKFSGERVTILCLSQCLIVSSYFMFFFYFESNLIKMIFNTFFVKKATNCVLDCSKIRNEMHTHTLTHTHRQTQTLIHKNNINWTKQYFLKMKIKKMKKKIMVILKQNQFEFYLSFVIG